MAVPTPTIVDIPAPGEPILGGTPEPAVTPPAAGTGAVETPSAPAPQPPAGATSEHKLPEVNPKPKGTVKTSETKPALADGLSKSQVLQWMLDEQSTTGKPFDINPAVFDTLSPDAQKLVAGLVFEARAAGGKLKETISGVQTAAQTAAADKVAAAKERALALDWVKSDALKAAIEEAKLKPGEAPDPLTEEGLKRLARAQAAEQFAAFIDTIKQDGVRREEAAAAVAAEAALDAERASALQFMRAHRDDFQPGPVFDAIKALKQAGVSLERAHQLVKAEQAVKELEAAKSVELEESRARLSRPRPSGPVIPEMPPSFRGNSAKELEFYTRYPEAALRDAERLAAKGR